ncbi:hypothetical protein [Brenneria corticis]|uniref:Uncharacterized protein n=1 Tax=Brenneria corticis TaxID=2173106 RepID=A0A2U1TMQ7_9GAMM|nr:hypothetical protein [Brenneria sp. CFCC 11842]PWC10707.1 hypothetical protein DDT56_21225 [Brenneria sp. CFCC 11842]
MKGNKGILANTAMLIFLVFGFSLSGVLICMIGVPLGMIVAFFKTGQLIINLDAVINSALFALKIGGGMGAVSGGGLWVFAKIIDAKKHYSSKSEYNINEKK